jgi:hypothetical protein
MRRFLEIDQSGRKKLPVVTMFVYESGNNEQSL